MKIKSILPLGNQILVKPDEKATWSGEKTLNLFGEIVAVGKDVKELKVGDWIVYEKWGLKSPVIYGETYQFIQESSPFLLGLADVSADE